jgi:two-component system, OmpR family, phosphate regulon sensor histidine kinase PhoR
MMSPWQVLRAALLIGGVPVLVLVVLMLSGALALRPGGQALVICGLAAVGVAWIWINNLTQLAEALRRAEDRRFYPPKMSPLLPVAAEVAEGVRRLSRSLAERGELVDRLRRADGAIVENLPDPLLVLAPNREPLRANVAARGLFGADIAAVLRHPALAEAVERALAARRPQTADLVLPVPMPRELQAQVIPMEPPLADGGALVVVLSDRTRERAVERMRADFVANASHELRTPLASLIGFIETLRGPAEDDPPARARFLGIMAEQAERMRRLIDDLLGLSRIEITEHRPPSGEADLATIARAEVAALTPLLQGRGVQLTLELEEGALAAPADAEQLAQVMRNLLENAIRYGRENGQVVLRTAHEERRGQPGVTLSVSDDGPGIPKEHIPRLTERFYRVDRGRSRAAGGTGLGLAIVKHIVNRHRGMLAIESQEGMGATFRIWLPAAPRQTGERPLAAAAGT